MARTETSRFDIISFAPTGMWGASLTGSESGHDDDGAGWTIQTWLITAPHGENMGVFASDMNDAQGRLRAVAY